jgi:hypothetical protein
VPDAHVTIKNADLLDSDDDNDEFEPLALRTDDNNGNDDDDDGGDDDDDDDLGGPTLQFEPEVFKKPTIVPKAVPPVSTVDETVDMEDETLVFPTLEL